MFWIGLQVGVEIEIEGGVTSGDNFVVHIAIRGADVTKRTCFGLNGERFGVHHT